MPTKRKPIDKDELQKEKDVTYQSDTTNEDFVLPEEQLLLNCAPLRDSRELRQCFFVK